MCRTLYVNDLKGYLARNQMSPEMFAKQVGLSNMTIRRWLKKPGTEAIPKKYEAALGPLFGEAQAATTPQVGLNNALASLDFDTLMKEIENSGKDFKDIKSLETDLAAKLSDVRLDQMFATYCKRLFQAAKSPKTPLKVRAIVVGALLYFISPIDLIPDYIPVVGYIDDLAVLAIAVNVLAESSKEKAKGLAKRQTPELTPLAGRA